MSHISFHAQRQGTVNVHGAERHHMLLVIDDIGNTMIPEHQRVLFGPKAVNACLRLRSDVLTLLVRINNQCESHCWIEGRNRAWIASLIQQGLQANLFRQGVGWPEVVDFLLAGEDPVVLSYSGSSPWPSYAMAASGYDIGDEEWENLPIELKWKYAEGALRAESDREQNDPDAVLSRELRPEHWSRYLFAEPEPALN